MGASRMATIMSPHSDSGSKGNSPKGDRPIDHRLKQIKSGAFSRGLALAKVSLAAGARAASLAVGNLFVDEGEKTERYKEMLISQVGALAQELGQLKGSLMKVGQLLSMHGEHFLPPEANVLLKALQNQSPPLEWKEIEKALRRQLTAEQLSSLVIEQEPIASASLGQVHRALRKTDGRWLAMKIQYPGVDRAIEGDLKALRSVLSFSKLIPKGPRYDELFDEVRAMLHHEVDYERELQMTLEFRARVVNDSRYLIPEVITDLSTKRVLTTSFESGSAVDSVEVLALSQERRNAIGVAALDLYFKELFEWGAVQTDPHFGNYRIRLGINGEVDRLVLFDFGAVRKLPKSFLDPYLEMVRGCLNQSSEQIIQGAMGMGFIRPEDSRELKELFVDLCFLISEPFYSETAYNWGESDLSKRVVRKAAEFAVAFRLRPPPREIIFLDRKMGGIFVFLSVLKVQTQSRDVIQRYI